MENYSTADTLEKVSVSHMNNAHSDWLRALHFYKDELKVLSSRLTEVATKNTGKEVMVEVEHFENQFRIQLDNIHTLAHEIKANVGLVALEAKANSAGYIDGILFTRHNELSTKFFMEEKIINELRHSFNQFAAEWM